MSFLYICVQLPVFSVLQGKSLTPITLMEAQVGVVTQATASDLGSAFVATATLYLQANWSPLMMWWVLCWKRKLWQVEAKMTEKDI